MYSALKIVLHIQKHIGRVLLNCSNFVILFLVLLTACSSKEDYYMLTVGIPSKWGNLTPSAQESVYVDPIISNEFETLIRVDKNGFFEPSASDSWLVSSDFKQVKFKINTNKRFSDGTYLTAQNVKDAWELGLRLTPRNSRSMFRDFLSSVKGYENFDNDKHISGLIVEGDNLIVNFNKPFRALLEVVSNSRMGIFLKIKDGFIGTGPYKVARDDGETVEMIKNSFYVGPDHNQKFNKIRFVVIEPEAAEDALKANVVQVYLFAERAVIRSCYLEKNDPLNQKNKIKCISGREGRHEYVSLNGLKNRFFANPKNRKAVQSMILSAIKETKLPEYMKLNNATIDPQVYLRFQPGRITIQEVDKIVSDGDRYISEFIEMSKKNPLYLITSDKQNWIQEALQRRGVVFTKNSGWVSKDVLLDHYNNTNKPDMIVGGVNSANGDPDGLYHTLNINGSHAPKMTLRPNLSEMLEQGRSITNRDLMNEHYKKVSREVLGQVPFVHIGFTRGIIAYRNDVLKVSTNLKNRSAHSLDIFEPIE